MPPPARTPRRAVPLACTLALLATLLAPMSTAAADGDYLQVVDITFPADPRAGGPLDGRNKTGYMDDFHHKRSNSCGNHRATDILGQHGWPVYAAKEGRITFLPMVQPSYGWMIRIAGDDGREYNYIHLGRNGGPAADAYAPGLAQGDRVARGQHIGFIGSSGNASESLPHLHFEIKDPRVSDPYGCTYINPYPSLRAAEARGDYGGSRAAVGPRDARSIASACPAARLGDRFDDTRGLTQQEAIACIALWGVTTGNGEGERIFGPSQVVTRAQMASFLTRAILSAGGSLPPPGDAGFRDISGTAHREAIERLARAGIVQGRDQRYDPNAGVRRDQMATFLRNAYEHLAQAPLAPPVDQGFSDVAGSTHRDSINQMAAVGVTAGVGGSTFDRASDVRRDQMAAFLARLLALAVDEGHAVVP
jgi:murein DD-endopeptidase MepM/ murein hydrolase activator NlpD